MLHFIVNKKGGAGKTAVASILLQYFLASERDCEGIDIDPMNRSFAAFEALRVTEADILSAEHKDVDRNKYDELVEYICNQPSERELVIDTGSNAYMSLLSVINQTALIPLLDQIGQAAWFHIPLRAGQCLAASIDSYVDIASQVEGSRCILWFNEADGPITYNGDTLFNTKVYKKYKDKTFYVVKIPQFDPQTYGQDLKKMLERNQTFEQAREAANIMSKQRLLLIQRDIFSQLDQFFGEGSGAEVEPVSEAS